MRTDSPGVARGVGPAPLWFSTLSSGDVTEQQGEGGARMNWRNWRLLAACVLAAGAVVAFMVLTKLGHAVAGNLVGALMAGSAVYSAYLQRRASRTPALEAADSTKLVVVCHLRADLRWALWIEDRLNSSGFAPRLQQLPTGEDSAVITTWAQQIIEESACVLVLATAGLQEAGEVAGRRVKAIAEARGGREQSVVLTVHQNLVSLDLDGVRTVSIEDIRQENSAWALIEDAVRSCGARSTGRRAASFGVRTTNFPGLGVASSNLPAVNPNFVGRAAELRQLRRDLVEQRGGVAQRSVTLHAMGGMGKTQLAAQFVNTLKDFDTVWWVHAHQTGAIYADLSALAQQLGLPAVADQNELRRLLWEKLRTSGRWLLVYDNAESEEKLRDLVPPAGDGSILITSQSPNWAMLVRRRFPLEQMSEQDSLAMLRRQLPSRDEQELAQIADQLGCLPLALEQAAAYMRETQCPPGRYLRQLERRFSETLERGTQAYYDQSAAATYRMARELTTDFEPLSGLLMELCGFLSPDAIPRDLFEAPNQAAALPPELAAAMEAGLPYDAAISAARRLSLLTVTANSFSMHRVVQKLIRDSLTRPVRRDRAATAMRLLSRAFPADPDDAGVWEICGALQSHCVAALNEADEYHLVSVESIRLSRRVGEYQRARSAFGPSLKRLEATLIQLQLRGRDDDADELAAVELALARVHFRLANLREAKEHAVIALGLHEAALGPNHVRTAANLLDLSQIQLELSEFDEALHNALRSLKIHSDASVDGGASPALAGLSLEALGAVQWRLGTWAEAQASLEKAIDLLAGVFGGTSGVTARVRTMYGLVLRDSSFNDAAKLAIAESELEQAHAVLVSTHGSDHPETVSAAIHLADTHHRHALARLRADRDEASFKRDCGWVAEEFELVMRRQPMQPKSPGRACGLVRQGHLLNNLGEHVRARELVQEARGIYLQSYGADHPYVAEALTRLISIEYDLNDHSEAERAANEAKRIYLSQYGPQHPYVKQICDFLADPEHGGRD